jgi:hypothetical protein
MRIWWSFFTPGLARKWSMISCCCRSRSRVQRPPRENKLAVSARSRRYAFCSRSMRAASELKSPDVPGWSPAAARDRTVGIPTVPPERARFGADVTDAAAGFPGEVVAGLEGTIRSGSCSAAAATSLSPSRSPCSFGCTDTARMVPFGCAPSFVAQMT